MQKSIFETLFFESPLTEEVETTYRPGENISKFLSGKRVVFRTIQDSTNSRDKKMKKTCR
jgi:hypothetical protein